MFTRDFDDEFVAVFDGLTERTTERVVSAINTVTSFPGLAKEYLPYSDTSRLGMAIRQYPVPKTYLIIFLEIDEMRKVIRFELLEDARRSPMHILEDLRNIRS